jgi:hypothetical protein
MLTTLFELAYLHQRDVPDDGTTRARDASHACGARGNGSAALDGETDTGGSDHYLSRDVLPSNSKCLGCHEEKQRSWKHMFLGR